MADFRTPRDLNDPWLREFRVLTGKNKSRTLDLWGGADLTVFLESDAIVALEEVKTKLPPNRRRFDLTGKGVGSTLLEARKGGRSGAAFVRPLKVIVPKPPSKDEFIRKLLAAGKPIAQKYKLPPSIMVAQAILESNAGASDLALLENVLYGITKRQELSNGKEPDWYSAGKTIAFHKTVAVAGQGPVMDRFCAANSYEQAVEIWAQYVTGHPRSKQRQGLFKERPWSESDRRAIADLMPALMFGKGHTNYPQLLMKVIAENGLAARD
jgi:hypothetical protein